MKTRAAAVQLPFAYVANPQEFADLVREPVERAAREGARLIVLPDYVGYALFGMFAFDLEPGAGLDEIARRLRFDSVPDMLRDRAPIVFDFYRHILQSLAARAQVWMAGGSAPEVGEAGWYNTALLFSPEGQAAGKQRQTHRSERERAWGMSVGDELPVFGTDIGRLGLVLGEEVRHPEVARILALQGANILIHPAALPAARDATGENDEAYLIDLWREVQANQVFGVQANLVGPAYRGRSAIYAPVEMTEGKRGMLARAQSDADAETIAAELDFDALQRVIDEYPVFDFFNYDLYRRLGGKADPQ